MVMMVFSHAGDFPDERTEGAADGLPLARLGSLWCNVAADWWEPIHPIVNVSGQHHLTSGIIPIVNGICERW